MVATHTSDGNEIKINDTDTTSRNSPHKLILNGLISKIIPGTICPIGQMIMEDVEVIGESLDVRQTVISKEITTDAAHSGARILWTPREVSSTGRDRTTPQDGNIVVSASS